MIADCPSAFATARQESSPEDLEILEAQQENILARPDGALLNLKIDAGGVHARRLVERGLERTGAALVGITGRESITCGCRDSGGHLEAT
jgi:phenylpropionate dioxygenase-like ring-hydroxylating dioxygenase large terminal subunit